MNHDQTAQLLKQLGCAVPVYQPRNGWIISDCPFGPWRHDGGKSSASVFGVRSEPGDARGNCFSCGWHGTLSDLLYEIRLKNRAKPVLQGIKWADLDAMIDKADAEAAQLFDGPDIETVLFGPKPKPHVFPDWWLDSFPPALNVDFSCKYLHQRCVPDEITLELGLRADTKQGRVCFPVRDFSGKLMGLHGRAIDEKTEPRYRMYQQAGKTNSIIWLGESWVNLDRPIVVVEGPFDLASVYRVYRNVVSPLFANPSIDKLRRMTDAIEWITLYDRGKGGDAGRDKVQRVMGRAHVVTHLYPPEGCKDPGMMSEQQLVDILSTVDLKLSAGFD